MSAFNDNVHSISERPLCGDSGQFGLSNNHKLTKAAKQWFRTHEYCTLALAVS